MLLALNLEAVLLRPPYFSVSKTYTISSSDMFEKMGDAEKRKIIQGQVQFKWIINH